MEEAVEVSAGAVAAAAVPAAAGVAAVEALEAVVVALELAVELTSVEDEEVVAVAVA